PALLRGLENRDRQVWYRSAFALGRIGVAALQSLEETLQSKEASVRRGAAKALGWIGTGAEPAVGPPCQLLRGESAEARQESAEALYQIGPATLPVLLETMGSDSVLARAAAAFALGRFAPTTPSVMQVLLDATNDKDKEVRGVAVAALGQSRVQSQAVMQRL